MACNTGDCTDVETACANSAGEPIGTTSAEAMACNVSVVDKVVNGSVAVTTRTGKTLLSLDQLQDLFGFGVAPFTFTTGGTLTSIDLLVSNDPTDSFLYQYIGSSSNIPLVIPPLFDPTASADWQSFTATVHNLLSGKSEAGAHDEIYTRQFNSIADMQAVTALPAASGMTVCRTLGFSSVGDGGGAEWRRTGVTGGPPNTIDYSIGTVFNAVGAAFEYVFIAPAVEHEVNPLAFGATTDGLPGSSVIVSGLLNTFAHVIVIPSSVQGMELSNITIPDGKAVIGSSELSRVKAPDGVNLPVFRLSNKSQIRNLSIFATGGKDSGLTGQHGITLADRFETIVDTVLISGMGGQGYGGLNAATGGVHEGSTVSNLRVTDCNIGMNIEERFEYVNASNCTLWANNIGLLIRGGNLNATGTIITDNLVGVKLIPGANGLHGGLTGGLINHNVNNAIFADAPNDGFVFTNVQMFGNGPIHLKDCRNIRFNGGAMGTTAILEENCFECSFVGVDMKDGINNTPNYNGSISEVFYLDCFLPGSVSAASFESLNGAALNVVQVATVPVPVGLSDFTFDTINYNAITANQNYFLPFYAGGEFSGAPRVRGGINLNFKLQICVGVLTNPSMVANDVIIKLVSVLNGDTLAYLTPVDTPTAADAATFIRYALNGSVSRETVKIVIENKLPNPVQVFTDLVSPGLFTRGLVTGW